MESTNKKNNGTQKQKQKLKYYLYDVFHYSKVSLLLSSLFPTKIRCPAGIYMFKVNNKNTRTSREIYSKLTTKTPARHHWRRSGVFIVNFEHISHLVLVFLLLTLSRSTFLDPIQSHWGFIYSRRLFFSLVIWQWFHDKVVFHLLDFTGNVKYDCKKKIYKY